MTRENAAAKAARLLVSGAVDVLETSSRPDVLALVHGDHDVYRVRFDRRWWCTCPAPGPCSHGIAVALVVHRGGRA